MTRPERDAPTAAHHDAGELLPWYVTGTLEAGEARSVETHLATCPACREELAQCRALASALGTASVPAWAPASGDGRREPPARPHRGG